jgi:hypothetical protein
VGWGWGDREVTREGALNSHKYNARGFGLVLALGVMLATMMLETRGFAQVEIGSNTSVTMSGDLGFGYNGEYGNQIGSSHGLSLNGDGVMQGYYYSPKFLNFFVDPVYNRSQANSGQGSITDATSINAGVNLFSGSHFPGFVSFGQAFNSSGNYGFGTTPGFTTSGNSRSFGIGWAELIPGWVPLSVQYTQSASSSSIFGTDQEDHSGSKDLNLFSNYKLHGWYMGARFTDTWTHEELPSALTGSDSVTGDTNDKEFAFNANHKLSLWRGSFGASYAWSDFSGDNNGSTVSGANQVIAATAGFAPTDRFTTQFQFLYDSSLSGAVEQQLIGLGGVAPDVNLGTHSYSISMSNSDNLVLTRSLSVGFNIGHTQQEVFGESVSATHFSAIVNYRFLKPLWGTVVIYAGVNDQATDAGNQGAGLVAGVNFNKQWSNFLLSGSFAYSQDTQTILATDVTSNYSYMANAQRRLTRRLRWMATFNGFHTGMGELTGSDAHSESYGTQLIYKMYNLGGNYSHTSGTALLTASGLVVPPGTVGPVLTGNEFLLDTGSSYSVSFTANPIRRLQFATSYTRTRNDSTAASLATNTNSKVFTVFTDYQFRKMVFTAGYTNLNQFVSTAGMPAANYTNFYVGIQRWFKAF